MTEAGSSAPIPNDSAARLHAFAIAMRSQPPERQLGQSVAEIVGLSWPTDYADVAVTVGVVAKLPATVRSEVETLADEDHTLLLEHLPSLEAALSSMQNLVGSTQSFTQQLRDDALYSLRMCSSALRRKRPERQLDRPTVNDLRAAAVALRADVDASDLSNSTKALVDQHLAAIDQALRLAPVAGIAGVEAAFDGAIGALHRRRDVADELIRESRHEQSAAHRFWEWMGRLATVVTIVGGTLQIKGAATEPTSPPPALTITVDQDQTVSVTTTDPPTLTSSDPSPRPTSRSHGNSGNEHR